MNRVTCGVCSECALASPLLAEQLEGLGLSCAYCGAFGHVSVREDDEGGLAALVLIVKECSRCNGPIAACDCEDPRIVGYPETA